MKEIPAKLDDPSTYDRLDPSGMRYRLGGLAEQCRRAAQQARTFRLPDKVGRPTSVVIVGMGGSAIGGQLVAGLAEHLQVPIPIVVWRDYGLPAWVGPDTLVAVCSYSGNTEETLSAFQAALDRKALVIAVTSGGRLAEKARVLGVPTLHIDEVGEPRNALGYTFIALLGILRSLGFWPTIYQQISGAAKLLEKQAEQYGPLRLASENVSKTLALTLRGTVPIVYGAGFLAGVAWRWKTDLNENSKSWAVAEILPEVHHNSVVGYTFPAALLKRGHVLLLSSPLLPKSLRRSVEVTIKMLRRAGVRHTVVAGEGEDPLSHMLGLVYLGTWTSYYLGLLYGVDPSPVEPIQYLKRLLRSQRKPKEVLPASPADSRKLAAL